MAETLRRRGTRTQTYVNKSRSAIRRNYTVPWLENVVEDPVQFREEMIKIEHSRVSQEINKQAAMKKLQDDPYDEESQKMILKSIQEEAIMENFHTAMEHNPELFASVTMLFINTTVNNRPVKAFVDSGAQATIMSPSCAERCGIAHLIDERFQGMAMGVGTARILGRIHSVPILIGDQFWPLLSRSWRVKAWISFWVLTCSKTPCND